MTNGYIGVAALAVLLFCAGWVRAAFKKGHGEVVWRVAIVSGSLALVSIVVAILLQTIWYDRKLPWSNTLIGFWVAAPPIWFFYEYAHWPPREGIEDERMRHFHDLGRNIWLALVAILAAIMGIHGVGSE